MVEIQWAKACELGNWAIFIEAGSYKKVLQRLIEHINSRELIYSTSPDSFRIIEKGILAEPHTP